MNNKWSGDRGASGLLFTMGLGCVSAATVATGLFVAATNIHTAVQSAADLTAISVAARLLTQTEPCEAGQAIAQQNGGEMAECVIQGNAVQVTVEQDLPPLLSQLFPGRTAHGSARAELQVDYPALPQ